MELSSFYFKLIPFLSTITMLAFVLASVFAYQIRKTLLTKIMVFGFSIQVLGMLVSFFSKYQGMFSDEYVDMSNSVIGFLLGSIGMLIGSVSLCVFLYEEYKTKNNN